MHFDKNWLILLLAVVGISLVSCNIGNTNGSQEKKTAVVCIKNNFSDVSMDRKPPWTIAKCSYQGVEFGKIKLGDLSAAKEVVPGLDYVIMVACWADTACSTQNCLPIASKVEEEVVAGQIRTVVINAPNHQGPCPPLGVEPIPQILYNRILELWPEYGFKPYAQRAQNPQCQ
jgi:hypothetical protein